MYVYIFYYLHVRQAYIACGLRECVCILASSYITVVFNSEPFSSDFSFVVLLHQSRFKVIDIIRDVNYCKEPNASYSMFFPHCIQGENLPVSV